MVQYFRERPLQYSDSTLSYRRLWLCHIKHSENTKPDGEMELNSMWSTWLLCKPILSEVFCHLLLKAVYLITFPLSTGYSHVFLWYPKPLIRNHPPSTFTTTFSSLFIKIAFIWLPLFSARSKGKIYLMLIFTKSFPGDNQSDAESY